MVRAELLRRLPAARIRVFAPYGHERPTRSDRGEPVEPLGTWSLGRVEQLSDELDLVLVAGGGFGMDGLAGWYGGDAADVTRRGAGRFLVEGLGPARDDVPPVWWHVLGGTEEAPVASTTAARRLDIAPHPAVLVRRLVPAAVVDKRLEYLRLMGWYPPGRALVVQGGSNLVPHVKRLASSLQQVLDDDPDLTPVVAELSDAGGDAVFAAELAGALAAAGTTAHRLPLAVSHEDVAAALCAADAFVGGSIAGCLTALAYGRPWALLALGDAPLPLGDDEPERVVGAPDEVARAYAYAVHAGTGEKLLSRLEDEFDRYLDEVAAEAAMSARARHPEGLPDPARPALDEELRALRRAHRALSERAYAERVLLADHVARADAELALLRAELAALRPQAELDAAERSRLEAEYAALRDTRTFRWTASARALYRRLGGGMR